MKRVLMKISLILMAMLFMLAFTACGGTDGTSEETGSDTAAEETTEAAAETTAAPAEDPAAGDGQKYGYDGEDAAELAAYKYMIEEVSKDYEKADASIPVVAVINKDESNPDDVMVQGDFQIYNYNIEGETLKCASGGDYPGCMHMKKNEDGTYTVSSFDVVKDGGEFEPSAREIFGDNYDKFVSVQSDDDALEAQRGDTISVYVKANDIPCTKYQDEGWDPVDLKL